MGVGVHVYVSIRGSVSVAPRQHSITVARPAG